MAIEFGINGYFRMSFINVVTEQPVADWIEKGILDNLQQGEYTIGMASKHVYDINDLQNPVYKFELEATTNLEYEFEEF